MVEYGCAFAVMLLCFSGLVARKEKGSASTRIAVLLWPETQVALSFEASVMPKWVKMALWIFVLVMPGAIGTLLVSMTTRASVCTGWVWEPNLGMEGWVRVLVRTMWGLIAAGLMRTRPVSTE